MTPGGNKKFYIGGAALLLAVAAVILAVFSMLSRTDKTDLYLADNAGERCGWRYEVLADGRVQAYEPVFQGEYGLPSLPEGTEAVRITRTMTEDIPRAELEWMCYMDAVEVSLDGVLLHTDFPQLDRDEAGFVHPDREQWQRLTWEESGIWRRVRMSLPENYLGKELSLTTYFLPDSGVSPVLEYPFIGSEDAAVAGAVVFSVRYNAIMTIYALLTLAMVGMFLLDVHNRGADGRTLLLCLYFLLLFLEEAYGSDAGYYSVFSSRVDLRFLQWVYIAPLYLYLALRLTSRWKWPLCACILAWALDEGIRELLRSRQGLADAADKLGPGALVVFLAITVVFCVEEFRRERQDRTDKKHLFRYGTIAAAVAALYVLSKVRAWGGVRSYFHDGVWLAVTMGNYGPVISLFTDITSYVTVIVVVTEVVRRTMRTRRTVDVLRERSRLTLEGYERMLRAEERTNAAKHEMRHHMTALAGLLQEGDTARAAEYIASVTDALDKLPTVRYSSNVLVNAIAGVYLDQAKARGIRVDHSLRVPPELGIADEDLSVFLTNLLENALQACQRMGPGQTRFIRLKMAVHENFLFIGCTNSAPDEQEEEELDEEQQARRQHGYGLEAMRQIAEKYSSMLLLERMDGAFSVKSNFSLRGTKT